MSGMKIRQSLTICVWGFFICVMVENINAFQFVVGGSNGWMVPNTSSTMYYKSWAERNRFSIGDSIFLFIIELRLWSLTKFLTIHGHVDLVLIKNYSDPKQR
ncbi:hypothetical protein LINPERHAP2_LOCUS23402, partial [Linum perenne]